MIERWDPDGRRRATLRAWSTTMTSAVTSLWRRLAATTESFGRRVVPTRHRTEFPGSHGVVVGGRMGRVLAVAGTLSRRPRSESHR